MAHAFGAFVRVDFVDLGAHVDRIVRALGLAHVAVDSFVGDQQRHLRLLWLGAPSARLSRPGC
jgi:hypothetical protein